MMICATLVWLGLDVLGAVVTNSATTISLITLVSIQLPLCHFKKLLIKCRKDKIRLKHRFL